MTDLIIAPDTETLWRQYSARLCVFIAHRIDDADAVDDMVQDIFLRVHERMGSVRDTGRIESWLFQIACNAIVDHYRRNRAGEPVPDWI